MTGYRFCCRVTESTDGTSTSPGHERAVTNLPCHTLGHYHSQIRTTKREVFGTVLRDLAVQPKLPSANPIRTSSPECPHLRASQCAGKVKQELLAPSKFQHGRPNCSLLSEIHRKGNGAKWDISFPQLTQFLEPGGELQKRLHGPRLPRAYRRHRALGGPRYCAPPGPSFSSRHKHALLPVREGSILPKAHTLLPFPCLHNTQNDLEGTREGISITKSGDVTPKRGAVNICLLEGRHAHSSPQ